jgi:hypothetical protein
MQFPNQIAQAIAIHDASGNLIIQIGPSPSIVIYNVPPSPAKITLATVGAQPSITFTGDDGSDRYSIENSVGVPSTLDIGDPGTAHSRIHIDNATPQGVSIYGDNSVGVRVRSTDGYLYADRLSGIEDWQTVTLPGGWGVFFPCQFILDASGFVNMRGLVNAVPNPIPNGTIITTMPAGYRPFNVSLYTIAFDSSFATGVAILRTNGDIELYNAPNNLPWLNSIRYSVK